VKLLFIDCETTGTNPDKHGLVQLAGSIFVDGLKVDQFNLKAAPFPADVIEDEALEVNGLTHAALSEFPNPSVSYRSFTRLLGRHCDKFDRADKFHFIGYNADFDSDFVRRWFEKNGDKYFGSFFWWPILDVSKLAGIRLMSQRHHLANFKLMTVARYMGIEVDESQAHDAFYDISLTMEIFKVLSRDLPLLNHMAAKA
jgi:DNA polymerase-3 subunit epsilon